MSLVIPQRPKLITNPLAYPAGIAPGFDLTHPAAQGADPHRGFSGVALGGGFVNLLTGAKGALFGTAPTGSLLPIGPAAKIAFGQNGWTWSGQVTVTETVITLAAIFTYNVASSAATFVGNAGGTTGGGYNLVTGNGTDNFLSFSVDATPFTVVESPLLLTVGHSYFAAASAVIGSTINFVLCDLTTGSIKTATVSNTLTAQANHGAANVGGTHSFNGAAASIAAAMFSPVFLSKNQLATWGANPWAFWYPAANQNIVGSSAGLVSGAGEADAIFTAAATSSAKAAESGAVAALFTAAATSSAVANESGAVAALFTAAATSTAQAAEVGAVAVLFTAAATSTATAKEAGEADALFGALAASSATAAESGAVAALFGASATSAAAAAEQANAAAIFTAAAISTALAKEAGEADAIFGVSGIGTSSGASSGAGEADALFTASAVSKVAAAAQAEADALFTAAAISSAAAAESGEADAIFGASAVGASATSGNFGEADAVFAVSGQSAASAASGGEADALFDAEGIGAASGAKKVGWFREWDRRLRHDPADLERRLAAQKGISRKYIEELITAEVKKPKVKVALVKAITAAVEAGEAVTNNYVAAEKQRRLEEMLAFAVSAHDTAQALKAAKAAYQAALAVIEAANDNEEEEIAMLLAA